MLTKLFSDVFCQFSLFGRCEESWSTEPLAINNGSAKCDATWDLAVKTGPELIKVNLDINLNCQNKTWEGLE